MKIKRLHKDAMLPRYSTEGASAFDVFAYKDVEWVLKDDTTWEDNPYVFVYEFKRIVKPKDNAC